MPPRDWLTELFALPRLERHDRLRVLAGTPGPGQQDAGKIICSCYSVGRNMLRDVIRELDEKTPERIGAACQAGTNCGSCVPELKELIVEFAG